MAIVDTAGNTGHKKHLRVNIFDNVTAQATSILKATLALPAVGITNPSSHHISFPGLLSR
jgi:hypothetical protein